MIVFDPLANYAATSQIYRHQMGCRCASCADALRVLDEQRRAWEQQLITVVDELVDADEGPAIVVPDDPRPSSASDDDEDEDDFTVDDHTH